MPLFFRTWFSKLNLGVKLNLLVLLVLGVLLISIIALLNRNTNNLTQEVGKEQIAQESISLQNRLTEVEENLVVDINFLVSSVNFFQAVGTRDVATTQEIIDQANASLIWDDVDVVDGDGKRLVDLKQDANSQEDRLLNLALAGEQTTALLIEQKAGEREISVVVVAPVVSTRGNRLGAILIARQINNAFLEKLILGQTSTHIGLIYDNRILARTGNGTSPDELGEGIVLDKAAVEDAQSGQTVFVKELIEGKGVPHSVAYMPIVVNDEVAPIVIMIMADLRNIDAFQSTTQFNTILIFVILTCIALIILYLAIRQTTIYPLQRLKSIAQHMTSGQYDERVPVTTQDEVGQLALVFNTMADAIQQREESLQVARVQAEQADKVKSMFLASVSHELRTPLNAVINLTKFVGQGLYGPVNEKQIDALQKTEASGKHLLELINDVLDISKIEAGSLELFVEEGIQISPIIELTTETGKSLLNDKKISIAAEIQPDLPAVTGDEQRIRQILFNLMSNACKFTEQGQITLKAYRQNGELCIAIQDTGPGIDSQDYETIFETFRQTKVGLRKGGGTGLGLPISRRLAEAHGGRLWLESHPNVGTTFYLALPIESPLQPTV